MVELCESDWKYRFTKRLATLFMLSGVKAEAAIADAEAHANDYFPHRGTGEPEQEANKVHDWAREV